MLLGDVIAELDDEAAAMEMLLSLGDLALVTRVEEAAVQHAVTPGEFAAQAVALFSNQASDEDWVSLIGVMGQTTDPGQVCLKKMVEFALRPAKASHGCGHHG
jgi:hypothetical protein